MLQFADHLDVFTLIVFTLSANNLPKYDDLAAESQWDACHILELAGTGCKGGGWDHFVL